MIGEIYIAMVPYFDVGSKQIKAKKRPVLIIADIDSKDYAFLPISTVKNPAFMNPEYDIEIDPQSYPDTVAIKSYVRTNKQSYVHRYNLLNKVSDLKNKYPDLYESILQKREKFNDEITKQSRS